MQSIPFLCAKVLGGGIILTTGMVHILMDGITDLNGVNDFPIAVSIAEISMIFMFFLEMAASSYFKHILSRAPSAASTSAQGHGHGHGHGHDHGQDAEPESLTMSPQKYIPIKKESGENSPLLERRQEIARETSCDSLLGAPPRNINSDVEGDKVHSDGHHHDEGHHHVHIPIGPISVDELGLRAVVIAHVLELGIVVHSVIIGVGLGVTTDMASLKALIIALLVNLLDQSSVFTKLTAQMLSPVFRGNWVRRDHRHSTCVSCPRYPLCYPLLYDRPVWDRAWHRHHQILQP